MDMTKVDKVIETICDIILESKELGLYMVEFAGLAKSLAQLILARDLVDRNAD